MKKFLTVLPIIIAFMFVFSGIASAHVSVDPSQVQANSWQKFTIKMPTEKDIPTVKLQVTVPKGAEVESVEPVPGWTYSAEKDKNGRVTSMIWTAEGKGLEAGYFMEFPYMAKVGENIDRLQWKAYQTYSDGSVVKWIGPKDSDHPAYVTKVVSAENANAAGQTGENSGSQVPLYLSIIAVVLSVAAIIISIVRKRA
ncbi:MAG: YcnI family protein [Tuberibacillus sp.]